MKHIKNLKTKIAVGIILVVIIVTVVILSILTYDEKRTFLKAVPDNYYKLANKEDNTIELPNIDLGEEIPKIFHRTHETKETIDLFSDVEEKIKKLHPDYEIINYTSEDRENFIKQHFSKRIFKAYKSINPIYGNVKADFFRYCVVYIKGGIYLDIKSVTTKNVNNILERAKQKMIVTKDYRYFTYGYLYYLFPYGENSCWLIIAPKGHRVLKQLILHSVINIESDYGKNQSDIGFTGGHMSSISIAGPIIYTLITNKKKNQNDILHLPILCERHFLKSGTNYYGKNGKQELSTKMVKTKPYSKLQEPIVKEYTL